MFSLVFDKSVIFSYTKFNNYKNFTRACKLDLKSAQNSLYQKNNGGGVHI